MKKIFYINIQYISNNNKNRDFIINSIHCKFNQVKILFYNIHLRFLSKAYYNKSQIDF